MFLRLFRGAKPAHLIFVPVFAVLLWLKYLILPQPVDITFEPNPMPLYQLVSSWFENSGILSRLVTLALLIFNALWISRLNTKYILVQSRTYLPSFLFLLIVSAFLPLQQLNPALIASICLVLCIDIMFETYKKEELALQFFQAAFLLSVASLFYARAVYLMFGIWTGLVLLRVFRWREWAFTILGFLVPYIFLFAYYYFSGRDLQENWTYIMRNFFTDPNYEYSNVYYLVFYAYLFILLILASLRMMRIYQGLKIYIRKFYRLNFWLFAISVLVFFLLYSRSVEFIYFIAIPISYMLAYYLLNLRSKWTGEVMFGLLLALFGLILVFN